MTVIDDYLSGHTGPHRALMDELCALVRNLVPEATEKLSYGMPTFFLGGNLVHFAAGKNHVGFYPAPSGVAFAAARLDELGLKHSKGAIQFPLGAPLPRDLVADVVRFRVAEQRAKLSAG